MLKSNIDVFLRQHFSTRSSLYTERTGVGAFTTAMDAVTLR